jgi:hypothetical protein
MLLYRGAKTRKQEVQPKEMFHVKQHPAASLSGSPEDLFHVKQTAFMVNKVIKLLPDAKIPEDRVEDILDIDPAEQPADRVGRDAEVLGG